MSEKEKTVFEGEREIPVYTECDLLVVGGGAAGHSAAVAAARAGCKNIVLMERYGYMGGDVTGGYVIMVPRLSFYNKQYVRGLQEEWFSAGFQHVRGVRLLRRALHAGGRVGIPQNAGPLCAAYLRRGENGTNY